MNAAAGLVLLLTLIGTFASNGLLDRDHAASLLATIVLPVAGDCTDWCISCPNSQHANIMYSMPHTYHETTENHDCRDPYSCAFGHVSCELGVDNPVADLLSDPSFWTSIEGADEATLRAFLAANPATARFNEDRGAIQVYGCSSRVIASIQIPAPIAAKLNND